MIAAAELEALVCQLPHHVLLLSGYFPVLGQSLAVLPAAGDALLIVPEAEVRFARQGWISDIRPYLPASLEEIQPTADVLAARLADACRERGLATARLGFEGSPTNVPAPYLEFLVPGCAAHGMWRELLPGAQWSDAIALLDEAMLCKTPGEVARIRQACWLGGLGMEAARAMVRPGVREVEVAAAAYAAMTCGGAAVEGLHRADAWAFCRSGPRAAEAFEPYQFSTDRPLQPGDVVLVHINCHLDGYWTDLTRTFFVGEPAGTARRAYAAVLDAWGRAVQATSAGICAAAVDEEARSCLRQQGFGDAYRHLTGHGVGFRAIGHGIRPIIHPASTERLRPGMVFNIEPAVYLPEQFGIRLCDVIAVGEDTADLLSDIPRDMAWAVCG